MNDSSYNPTLCVGANAHLDEIVLRVLDKALDHVVSKLCRIYDVEIIETGLSPPLTN